MSNSRGFTIIELIMVIVITGIIVSVAGMGIVKVTEGLILAKDYASISLKAQVAFTRIEKEGHIITAVASGTATSLSYRSNKGGVPGDHTLSYNSSNKTIELDGVTLVDKVVLVGGGLFTYMDSYNGTEYTTWATTSKIIKITFSMTGAESIQFSMRYVPRML